MSLPGSVEDCQGHIDISAVTLDRKILDLCGARPESGPIEIHIDLKCPNFETLTKYWKNGQKNWSVTPDFLKFFAKTPRPDHFCYLPDCGDSEYLSSLSGDPVPLPAEGFLVSLLDLKKEWDRNMNWEQSRIRPNDYYDCTSYIIPYSVAEDYGLKIRLNP